MKIGRIALAVAALGGCGGNSSPAAPDLGDDFGTVDLRAIDLATVDETPPPLRFAPAVQYPVAPGRASLVAMGDVDGDGHLDVVALSDDTTISVLLGAGDGTLAPFIAVPDSAPHQEMWVRDLNGDGRGDLILDQRPDSRYVDVMLAQGGAAFAPFTSYYGGWGISGMALGRFGGQGRVDIVTSDTTTRTLALLAGGGDGTFAFPSEMDGGMDPLDLIAADFDGDGHDDLAIIDGPERRLLVRLGRGDGTFGPELATASSEVIGLAAGELSGDQILDLAVCDQHVGGGLTILVGVGDGTFKPTGQFVAALQWLAVADFDGDGHNDLIGFEGSSIGMRFGGPGGTLAPGGTVEGVKSQLGFAVGDLDGNGKPDLVAVSYEVDSVAVYLNDWTR